LNIQYSKKLDLFIALFLHIVMLTVSYSNNYVPMLLIPFRSNWNFSCRSGIRNVSTIHSTSSQISVYFGMFQLLRSISASFGRNGNFDYYQFSLYIKIKIKKSILQLHHSTSQIKCSQIHSYI